MDPFCEFCGDTIFDEEEVHEIDGENACEDCARSILLKRSDDDDD